MVSKLKNLEEILHTGLKIRDQVNHTTYFNKDLENNPYIPKLDKTIKLLSDQKQKISSILQTLSRHTRHILTPILTSITGLASAKTVSQLHSILSKIDLRSQRNHIRSDELLLNQEKLTQTLDDSIKLVNKMSKSIISYQKNTMLDTSINTLINTFLDAANDILKHYDDQFHIIQNPTYLIQSLSTQDIANIEKTIKNHADITSSIHPINLNLLTLLKMSHAELFTDKQEKILYLMVLIPLFDPAPHKIINFSHNRLIT